MPEPVDQSLGAFRARDLVLDIDKTRKIGLARVKSERGLGIFEVLM